MRTPLVVIVGPTAVGKTALSLRVGQTFAGEIISADSRQIYRKLDIGTDKVSAAQRDLVPHHLIDTLEPDEVMTLAEFQARAFKTIDLIHQRQHVPFLVGGTGQWVWSVVEGWGIPKVAPDPVLRAELETEANQLGSENFHAKLAAVDPPAAQKLDPRNVRRVIRALEVYYKTGVPISEHQHKTPPPYQTLIIGLTRPREALYKRIDQRIEEMMAEGLVQEVETLVAQGYGWDLPAMSGLGYRQIGQYLQGDVTLEEAVALIKKETRRFVRQQYNWFRIADPRIEWFDINSGTEEAYSRVQQFLIKPQTSTG